ncbi:MAG: DUF6526 family protein [Gemmatimonadaceae bacterium]
MEEWLRLASHAIIIADAIVIRDAGRRAAYPVRTTDPRILLNRRSRLMEGQSYEKHTRWFPPYHFVAVPILVANVIIVGLRANKNGWDFQSTWELIFAVGVLVGVAIARVMTLRVQDRVIRLEMRLRLMDVLPAQMQSRVHDLRPGQLVALRFASDAELPVLVERCLSGQLDKPADIKKEIKTWVGDYLRA